MSDKEHVFFDYWPWQDEKKVIKKMLDDQSGPHLLYRKVKEPFRARLIQLIDHTDIPLVFLFGSPHIENYARTDTGFGLIDFDRALIGPYVSDLMMIMLSIALKREASDDEFVPDSIYQAFRQGYLTGIHQLESGWQPFQPLMNATPADWQLSTKAYVEAGKKWIKRARKHPLPPDDRQLAILLQQYFANRNQDELHGDIDVIEAGCAKGSMGRLHTFAVLTSSAWSDWVILDFKPALNYVNSTWTHSQFYHHPFQHEGIRMVKASQLLAPGVTDGESYATLNGIHYWARRLPPLSMKIKSDFSDEQLTEFAFAAGTQMGRGHALGLDKAWSVGQLEQHFEKNFSVWHASFAVIYRELIQSWQRYVEIVRLSKKV